eukprot:9030856-Pyramimonas_sp.AAC.1
MWPGNGVLVAPGSQNVAWDKVLESPRFPGGFPGHPVRIPPKPPWGIRMLCFDPTRNLSVFAVR